MNTFVRNSVRRLGLSVNCVRKISISSVYYLKQINERTEGKTIEVKGEYVVSDRKDKVLETQNPHDSCPLCRLNLKLKYSDVLVLEQFMRPDGTVLPRQVTGLCAEQQETVENLVMQAHFSGLFPSHKPKDYNPDVEESDFRQFKRYWTCAEDLMERKLTTLPGSWYYVRRY